MLQRCVELRDSGGGSPRHAELWLALFGGDHGTTREEALDEEHIKPQVLLVKTKTELRPLLLDTATIAALKVGGPHRMSKRK